MFQNYYLKITSKKYMRKYKALPEFVKSKPAFFDKVSRGRF